MWLVAVLSILMAQDGQQGPRPGWPCAGGRPVDPAYIQTSERTGGQVFLFQKSEVAHSGVVMSASYTHPATILRAIGNLNGTRDFEFPVDTGVESLLFLVSLQCRNSIRVTRPSGAEMSESNSALNIDLQAGRILRVDHPDFGPWKIRLTGTGLFVVSVLAKADIALTRVDFSTPQTLKAWLSGPGSRLNVQLVDAAGDRIGEAAPMEQAAEGLYQAAFVPGAGLFRILVTGVDASERPFQRVEPKLLSQR